MTRSKISSMTKEKAIMKNSEPKHSDFHNSRLTRREALSLLGAGAAIAVTPRVALGAEPTFPKGAIIRTILKDIPPDQLTTGATLFHEHLSLAPDFLPKWMAISRAQNAARGGGGGGRAGGAAPAAASTPPATPAPYFMQDVDLMSAELVAAKNEGIACIVDGGHPDMGRDFNFLKQISTKSGMPIVAGAGFYTEPFYPAEIATMSEDEVLQAILKQIDADPIGALGEIGSWDEITDIERKVFRAIGRAQAQTGLGIFTHTGIPGKSALEQLDILEKAGAKPNRIVIGHVGNLVDPKVEVHKEICKRGAFVGFDRQGAAGDARQVPMVMALIEAGYADHLMFSSDMSSANQIKKNGGNGYAQTLTVFVPKVKAAGATDDVLHTIMVDNPRRLLAFVPKKARKG
jgi:phosphotriesterase-related protein